MLNYCLFPVSAFILSGVEREVLPHLLTLLTKLVGSLIRLRYHPKQLYDCFQSPLRSGTGSITSEGVNPLRVIPKTATG